ncbi:ribosomal-protein-alanine N-acetyltransferase [candidate division GN15 bacterium]|nr:ribosomal-protein-alanine N-acetyltransferase [candidate division GN15 bacterium]
MTWFCWSRYTYRKPLRRFALMSDNDVLPTEVTYRPMTESDLDQVVGLEGEIFTDAWPRSAFQDVMRESGWSIWVACSLTTVIAYACWLIVADECHLANIAVAEQWRRKSVAKRFLERILSEAQAASCRYILLEVRTSNDPAVAFYRKHGFDVWYERPNYYQRPPEDALVMVRRLDGAVDSE